MKRESEGQRARRVQRILEALYQEYPGVTTALRHSNPLELLVATILSAQCTDVRVNLVTKELFQKYRTARDYARADLKTFEQEIHSTGFYRNKAKNIIAACKMLIGKHGGEVPADMDALCELPGVARKTANVVLGIWFKLQTGIVVDTHVHRVSQRLGLSDQKDPNKTEQDLMKLIHQKDCINFGNMIIWHGRKVCHARNPDCARCGLNKYCQSSAV